MIRAMDKETAQQQLFRANAYIQHLSYQMTRARSIIMHHDLQNKLLKIESQEIAQRHQVEKTIVKREVDILRLDHLRPANDGEPTSREAAAIDAAELYRRRLKQAKLKLYDIQRKLEARDRDSYGVNSNMKDQSSNDHHRMRALSSPSSALPPHRHKPRKLSTDYDNGKSKEDRLAALGMLASQVLSQQTLDDDREQHSQWHQQNDSSPDAVVSNRSLSLDDITSSSPKDRAALLPVISNRLFPPFLSSASSDNRTISNVDMTDYDEDEDEDDDRGDIPESITMTSEKFVVPRRGNAKLEGHFRSKSAPRESVADESGEYDITTMDTTGAHLSPVHLRASSHPSELADSIRSINQILAISAGTRRHSSGVTELIRATNRSAAIYESSEDVSQARSALQRKRRRSSSSSTISIVSIEEALK